MKFLIHLLPQKHVDKSGDDHPRKGNESCNYQKPNNTDLGCLRGDRPRPEPFLIRKKLRWNGVLVHRVAF